MSTDEFILGKRLDDPLPRIPIFFDRTQLEEENQDNEIVLFYDTEYDSASHKVIIAQYDVCIIFRERFVESDLYERVPQTLSSDITGDMTRAHTLYLECQELMMRSSSYDALERELGIITERLLTETFQEEVARDCVAIYGQLIPSYTINFSRLYRLFHFEQAEDDDLHTLICQFSDLPHECIDSIHVKTNRDGEPPFDNINHHVEASDPDFPVHICIDNTGYILVIVRGDRSDFIMVHSLLLRILYGMMDHLDMQVEEANLSPSQ